MQPYQKANEEIKRQGEFPLKVLGTAASLAIPTVAGMAGAKIAGKIAPFLSKYIPEGLAIKGLNKIDPRLGNFINKSMREAYDFNEIKDFIGEMIQDAQESQKSQENEQRNIIEQYSPELHQFMSEQIKSGRSPVEAGAVAQNDKRFSKAIQKLMKDHKINWSQIIQQVYGQGQQQQQAQEPVTPVTPVTQQQQGQGSQALLQAMQQTNQLLQQM
jgi:hypothetical protein